MEKQAPRQHNKKFEYLLWKNELEFNRRELAIFESHLLNLQRKIHPDRLSQVMTELYQYCHLVDKMLAQIAGDGSSKPISAQNGSTGGKSESCKYLREEIFYFEQSYRRFRNTFCSLAEGLEAA